jgi:hypothetical protein
MTLKAKNRLIIRDAWKSQFSHHAMTGRGQRDRVAGVILIDGDRKFL